MTRLLLLQARRDRVVLPLWVLGVAVLLLASATSVGTTYGGQGERGRVLALALATPALLALRGEPNGDSLGSAVHFQSYAFLAVAVALMNTFLAVRHGRADEERGRRDLLDAAPVRRGSAAVAVLLLGLAADAALGALALLGYLVAGLPATGAALSAAGLAATGAVFLGVGLLAGEAMPTSRAANGASVAIVLLAYALRAAGDALGRPDLAALALAPAWPAALSPIGWGEAMLPFTEDCAAPLLGLVALALGTTGAALLVRSRRETGASLLVVRPGPPGAGRSLVRPPDLPLRLAAGGLLAWAVGAGLLGLAAASLVAAVRDARIADPAVVAVSRSLGHTRGDLADALLSAILVLAGLLAAAAGVQAVLRGAEEETAGRAAALLAGPRSRAAWLLGSVAAGAAAVLVVLAATAAAVGVGHLVADEPDAAGRAVLQTLVQAPAALALTALAALAAAAAPRAAAAIGWTAYAVAVVVGLLGGLLRLPADVVRFSPVGSVPVLPTDDWGPSVAMLVAAGVLVAVGTAAVRHRDLAS